MTLLAVVGFNGWRSSEIDAIVSDYCDDTMIEWLPLKVVGGGLRAMGCGYDCDGGPERSGNNNNTGHPILDGRRRLTTDDGAAINAVVRGEEPHKTQKATRASEIIYQLSGVGFRL
jgi:hypothetical protein